MAVDALQLRPRTATGLFDAAVRLCATSAAPWALTLPAGAALVAALLHLVEAIVARRPLALPVALWTLAWVARAVAQGAACHHLAASLLAPGEPALRDSVLAALRRAPRLITASALMAVIDGALWLTTAGLGLLFVGAHHVGYAVAMRDEGRPLSLYATASRLLGGARHAAPWVRACGLTQLLVAFNLHTGAAAALSLGQQLLGLDVTFLERFASVDNPAWLATVAIITFALFEPLRAATATLLLIDGRVRQEGLDLLAQVEQWPARKASRGVAALGAVVALLAVPAWAAAPEGLAQRLGAVTDECGLSTPPADLGALLERSESERSALERLVQRLERVALDQGDCSAAQADLERAVAEVKALDELDREQSAADARADAQRILARAEFQERPEPAATEEDGPPRDEAPGWLHDLWERFLRWLKDLFRREVETPRPIQPPNLSGPMAGANIVMVVAIAAVVAVLAWVVLRGLEKQRQAETSAQQDALVQAPLGDAESALSRPAETWAGLADELAAQGRYREATRHLYLALLARLHREGAIDYEPTSSNWDYLRAFKGPGDWKPPFRELTLRFDFAWYGHAEVAAQDFHAFRAVAEPLLAPPPGSPPHA